MLMILLLMIYEMYKMIDELFRSLCFMKNDVDDFVVDDL